MKKFAMIMTAVAMLASNAGEAQNMKMGSAAQSAGTYTADNFAWGIGLGALAVIGVVVGVTAAAASSSPSSFSH